MSIHRGKSVYVKILYIILLIILLLYPFIFRYDVSKSTYWYYDFLSMSPKILLFLLLLIVTVSATMFYNKKISVFPFLCIVLVFSVVEVVGNYPMILARDIYLHGSSVKAIVEHGKIVETWNSYLTTHPGTFLLWAMVKIVTGLDIKIVNIIILLPITIIVFVIFLSLIFKYLKMDENVIYTIALFSFLLMNNQVNELTFLHFNTRIFSLLFLLLFIVTFIKEKKNIGDHILLFISFFILTISHILFSLIPVIFLLNYWLFEDKFDLRKVRLVMIYGTIYLIWNLSFGFNLFNVGITSFISNIYRNLGFRALQQLPTIPGDVPFFGVIAKNYYKIFIVITSILSILSVIIMRKNKYARYMIYLLFSTMFVFGSALFTSALMNSIGRSLFVLAIPYAFFIYTLIDTRMKNHINYINNLVIFSILCLFLIIPNYILIHEEPIVRGYVSPLNNCGEFMSSYRNNQPVILLGEMPYYYCYFEPQYNTFNINLFTHGLSAERISLLEVSEYFINNTYGIKLLDYRNIMDWSRLSASYEEAEIDWSTQVYTPIEQSNSLIYNNYYEKVYRSSD